MLLLLLLLCTCRWTKKLNPGLDSNGPSMSKNFVAKKWNTATSNGMNNLETIYTYIHIYNLYLYNIYQYYIAIIYRFWPCHHKHCLLGMKGSQWSKRRCCSLHWRVRSLGSHMCHSDASAAKTASARFLQISQYLRDIMGHVFDVLKWFESGLNWAPNPATSLWPPQGLSRGTCQPGPWESQLQVPWRWRACCLEQLCMDQDLYIGKFLVFSWFVQKWRTSSGHPGHPKIAIQDSIILIGKTWENMRRPWQTTGFEGYPVFKKKRICECPRCTRGCNTNIERYWNTPRSRPTSLIGAFRCA